MHSPIVQKELRNPIVQRDGRYLQRHELKDAAIGEIPAVMGIFEPVFPQKRKSSVRVYQEESAVRPFSCDGTGVRLGTRSAKPQGTRHKTNATRNGIRIAGAIPKLVWRL